MLSMDTIFVKYANSSEKWILPLPVVEKGQVKLRCYMTDKKEMTGIFNNCYTYNVDFNTLADFFSYKSHGQAYNELIKHKKRRTGFVGEANHIKGIFMMSDVLESAKNGRTSVVMEAINTLMSIQHRVFTMEAITKMEKEKRKKEKLHIEKLEKELLDMGYDY